MRRPRVCLASGSSPAMPQPSLSSGSTSIAPCGRNCSLRAVPSRAAPGRGVASGSDSAGAATRAPRAPHSRQALRGRAVRATGRVRAPHGVRMRARRAGAAPLVERPAPPVVTGRQSKVRQGPVRLATGRQHRAPALGGGMEHHLIALASQLPPSVRCQVCCLEASADYLARLTAARIEHSNLDWPILLRPGGVLRAPAVRTRRPTLSSAHRALVRVRR